jgi:hypothetical protein
MPDATRREYERSLSASSKASSVVVLQGKQQPGVEPGTFTYSSAARVLFCGASRVRGVTAGLFLLPSNFTREAAPYPSGDGAVLLGAVFPPRDYVRARWSAGIWNLGA